MLPKSLGLIFYTEEQFLIVERVTTVLLRVSFVLRVFLPCFICWYNLSEGTEKGHLRAASELMLTENSSLPVWVWAAYKCLDLKSVPEPATQHGFGQNNLDCLCLTVQVCKVRIRGTTCWGLQDPV